jgi:hypothetical protein
VNAVSLNETFFTVCLQGDVTNPLNTDFQAAASYIYKRMLADKILCGVQDSDIPGDIDDVEKGMTPLSLYLYMEFLVSPYSHLLEV